MELEVSRKTIVIDDSCFDGSDEIWAPFLKGNVNLPYLFICKSCQHWLLQGFDYCPKCGSKLKWKTSKEYYTE